jgi:hypothetical protein
LASDKEIVVSINLPSAPVLPSDFATVERTEPLAMDGETSGTFGDTGG